MVAKVFGDRAISDDPLAGFRGNRPAPVADLAGRVVLLTGEADALELRFTDAETLEWSNRSDGNGKENVFTYSKYEDETL